LLYQKYNLAPLNIPICILFCTPIKSSKHSQQLLIIHQHQHKKSARIIQR